MRTGPSRPGRPRWRCQNSLPYSPPQVSQACCAIVVRHQAFADDQRLVSLLPLTGIPLLSVRHSAVYASACVRSEHGQLPGLFMSPGEVKRALCHLLRYWRRKRERPLNRQPNFLTPTRSTHSLTVTFLGLLFSRASERMTDRGGRRKAPISYFLTVRDNKIANC